MRLCVLLLGRGEGKGQGQGEGEGEGFGRACHFAEGARRPAWPSTAPSRRAPSLRAADCLTRPRRRAARTYRPGTMVG